MLEQVDGVLKAIVTRRELAFAFFAEEDLYHASHAQLVEVMQHCGRAQPQGARKLCGSAGGLRQVAQDAQAG